MRARNCNQTENTPNRTSETREVAYPVQNAVLRQTVATVQEISTHSARSRLALTAL
jgi:hypothetical protein